MAMAILDKLNHSAFVLAMAAHWVSDFQTIDIDAIFVVTWTCDEFRVDPKRSLQSFDLGVFGSQLILYV